ncbi:hypothetical protein EV385_1883 [Krasilnikovia cinnamomea]|uniref:Flavin reductase n=1 Tax=Krasilnikovia cinnamomea TaxID=349313 RepID=A0A4Q7ZH60_9ACTN|nr:hypothetical protein EV385_1883 [Krasilnikovia cinnamomea]
MNDEHIEERPSWRCRSCGEPWPCDQAQANLAATLSPTALRIHMWIRLEIAAQDMPQGLPSEMFERFLRWTG